MLDVYLASDSQRLDWETAFPFAQRVPEQATLAWIVDHVRKTSATAWAWVVRPNQLSHFKPEHLLGLPVDRGLGPQSFTLGQNLLLVPVDGDVQHFVYQECGVLDRKPPNQWGDKIELPAHRFVSSDSRAPGFSFSADVERFQWYPNRHWEVMAHGCRFRLEALEPDPTEGPMYLDLCQYTHDDRLDVFMLATRKDFVEENWLRLQELWPSAKLFLSNTSTAQSLRAVARQSASEHFFVVDGDNFVKDEVGKAFYFRPREGSVFCTHIWFASNPLGIAAYGHGGIKLFPVSAFLQDEGVSTPGVDVTMGSAEFLEVHEEVVSEHRFNTSTEAVRRTARTEIRKLAQSARTSKESLLRLQAWVELCPQEPGVLAAVQDLGSLL